MTPAQLLSLLFASGRPQDGSDLRGFLKSCGPGVPPTPSFFERLVTVALLADRRLTAGAAGHQAAIRRLFPATPDGAIAAFCVSEDKGPRPAHILSTLTPDGDGHRLNGIKRWGSMSPLADVLYVAASVGQRDGRNQLRMVCLPAGRAGLSLDLTPYTGYESHMPIADISLVDVAVDPSEILPEDAYESFIKPFRLIEDVYNTAGVQIGVFRLGRTHGWPQDLLEDLVGLILQAHTISETPMQRAEDVVLMSAYFRASDALWNRLGDVWSQVPDVEREKWSPKIGTLGVAARARETRRQNAWSTLAQS
jgi:acyl-CoA dehydrogenase